jgi:hypothetical protein
VEPHIRPVRRDTQRSMARGLVTEATFQGCTTAFAFNCSVAARRLPRYGGLPVMLRDGFLRINHSARRLTVSCAYLFGDDRAVLAGEVAVFAEKECGGA